jgi:capsular exopolysaccharide synthesis family protein
MQDSHRDFTLRGYLDVLRRRRWLILLIAIICGAAAYGLSSLQKKSYNATASLAVSDPSQSLALVGGAYVPTETQLQLASAASSQVTRQAVVDGVKQALNSPLSDNALRSNVSVTIDPNSYALDITATSRDPATAAAIANAFAHVDSALTTAATRAGYRAEAKSLEAELKRTKASNATQTITIQENLARLQSLIPVAQPLAVSSTASVPSSPSSPKPARNTIAALIVGLLLGIALATARDALDRRLRHSADVTQVLDHPVVGHIRSEALGHAGRSPAGTRGLGSLSDPDEESFRILRENVRYLSAASDMRTVLVTSAMPEEGKSTVAACLAVAVAEAGKRTLLVECDLRRPVLAERFGLRTGPGLTDYLTGNAEPHELLQLVPLPIGTASRNGSALPDAESTLVCITSGTTVPKPAELLASERFRSFLAEVSGVYDTVILDTAPLLPVADTLGIIPDVSTLLICVRLKRTTRDQARAAQSALDRAPDRAVGLVLTDVSDTGEGYYGYYGAPTPAVAR